MTARKTFHLRSVRCIADSNFYQVSSDCVSFQLNPPNKWIPERAYCSLTLYSDLYRFVYKGPGNVNGDTRWTHVVLSKDIAHDQFFPPGGRWTDDQIHYTHVYTVRNKLHTPFTGTNRLPSWCYERPLVYRSFLPDRYCFTSIGVPSRIR